MTRDRALRGARWLFVLLALALAWWGFRGRWGEIGDVLADTGPQRPVAAVASAAVGLALTGLLWRLLLRWVGSEVGVRDAAAVFFVGQLGKYVPGSVWSVAVQAQLGRRHGVPVRSSVTASGVFLLVHTATGLLLGGLLAVGSRLGVRDDLGVLPPAAVAVGAIALAPPVLRTLADTIAGNGVRTRFGATELAWSVVIMAGVWSCYGASLLLLVPGSATGSPGLVGAAASFALAHAVGVLVVLAPAGVGAREAVLVAMLGPVVGFPAAAAAALLSRFVHALADFLVAGAAVAWAHTFGRGGRSDTTPEPARAGGR